jgi:hypothetical protein
MTTLITASAEKEPVAKKQDGAPSAAAYSSQPAAELPWVEIRSSERLDRFARSTLQYHDACREDEDSRPPA